MHGALDLNVWRVLYNNSNKTEAKITLPYLVLSWVKVVYLLPLFSCCSGCGATGEKKKIAKGILQMIVTFLDGGNEENDDKYEPEYMRVGPKQFSTVREVTLCNIHHGSTLPSQKQCLKKTTICPFRR